MLTELYQQKNYGTLIKIAEREGFDPQTAPLESMLIAASYLELGNIDKAVNICKILKPKLDDRPDFLTLYAACLRGTGRLAEAEVFYRETLTRFPDNPGLCLNFVNLLIDLGKFTEAESIASSVLEYDISNKRASELLALAKEKSDEVSPNKKTLHKKKKQANSKHERLRTQNSTYMAGLDPLAMAFSESEVSEDQRARKKRQKQKSPPPPKFQRLESEEVAEEMLAAARQALGGQAHEIVFVLIKELLACRDFNRQDDAYALLGDTYYALGQYDASEACFLTSLSLGASADYIHINLVSLACMRCHSHLARERLQAAKDYGIELQYQEKLLEQILKLEKEGSPPTFWAGSLYSEPRTKHEAQP